MLDWPSSGPNGSGKSTLLDIIAGRAEPAAGTVKRGKTVVVGFADQHSSDLDSNAIVRELVAGPHREPDHRDRALLERFWFDTTAQYAPVRMLSGRRATPPATGDGAGHRTEPVRSSTSRRTTSTSTRCGRWRRSSTTGPARSSWPATIGRSSIASPITSSRSIREGRSGESPAASPAGWPNAARPGGAAAPKSRAVARDDVEGDAAAGRSPSTAKASSARPSPYTVGRQLRETEQAMVKAQKRVDQLTEQLAHVATRQRTTPNSPHSGPTSPQRSPNSTTSSHAGSNSPNSRATDPSVSGGAVQTGGVRAG